MPSRTGKAQQVRWAPKAEEEVWEKEEEEEDE